MEGTNKIISILTTPIEYLKGVGPLRADLLKKELSIFTFIDLLQHFPIRHVDKTQVKQIREIQPQTDYIQVAGKLIGIEVLGEKRGKRLVAELRDASGSIDLVWFQGMSWMQKFLQVGSEYLVFGRVSFFQGLPQITHPEIELRTPEIKEGKSFLEPVYPSTEKLNAKGLGGRQIAKLTWALFTALKETDIPENIPEGIIQKMKLSARFRSFEQIHFPPNIEAYENALERLKFEELLLAQLRMGLIKSQRHRHSKGIVFGQVGDLFNNFYKEYLPFELTGAQKRVLKEIRNDTAQGRQMNRLLQGDVGSGKTIVALLTMLLAVDNGFQACLMAPTEILANQHFENIRESAERNGYFNCVAYRVN